MLRNGVGKVCGLAGIGDLVGVCNAQICRCCDAPTFISVWSAGVIGGGDFSLDILRCAVHIFGREKPSQIR